MLKRPVRRASIYVVAAIVLRAHHVLCVSCAVGVMPGSSEQGPGGGDLHDAGSYSGDGASESQSLPEFGGGSREFRDPDVPIREEGFFEPPLWQVTGFNITLFRHSLTLMNCAPEEQCLKIHTVFTEKKPGGGVMSAEEDVMSCYPTVRCSSLSESCAQYEATGSSTSHHDEDFPDNLPSMNITCHAVCCSENICNAERIPLPPEPHFEQLPEPHFEQHPDDVDESSDLEGGSVRISPVIASALLGFALVLRCA